MKFGIEEFPGIAKKIRSTDVYDIYDLKALDHLTVSMTVMHPLKETSGHSHEKEEEVYIFLEGSGEMQLGEERFRVAKGDAVLVKGGKFHKVFNTSEKELKFFCVFERYAGR